MYFPIFLSDIAIFFIYFFVIVGVIFITLGVLMFYFIIPYLYFNRLLKDANGSLNLNYNKNSFSLLNKLKGFYNLETTKKIDPFLPSLYCINGDNAILITIHRLDFSLSSSWNWSEKFLRKRVVVEIVEKTDVVSTHIVNFESKYISESKSKIEIELEKHFSGLNLDKRGIIYFKDNGICVQYSGFCNDSSLLPKWVDSMNQFLVSYKNIS